MFAWLSKLVAPRTKEAPDAVKRADDCKLQGDAFLDGAAWEDAARCYEESLSFMPRFAAVHSNLGFALAQMNRFERAQQHLYMALEIDPGLVNASYVLGTIAHRLGDTARAIDHFRAAAEGRPGFAAAWNQLANLLIELGDTAAAFDAYRRAAEADPASPEIMNNLAGLAAGQGDRHLAIAQYRRVLESDPLSPGARLNLVHQMFQTCEWDGVEAEIELVRSAVREAPYSSDNRDSPFSFLALPGTTEAEQRRCAEKWAYALYQPQYHARRGLRFDYRRDPGAKPHIAYLSADFHDHATARLMAEVFERHDRARFTVSAYSYGPQDGSAMEARLKQAFDRFIDVRNESIRDTAVRLHADRVDILVDLKGYTGDSRSAILALCPAPIQVNYLGYPGTMGADFIDYLIADRHVVPESSRQDYREEIVHLPSTYQPNDGRRVIPLRPERVAHGLPQQGFVFCCFNQTYKITPVIFDIWCRLLRETEGSVLWLIASESRTEENLRQQAQGRGVAASRLIFAPRTDPPNHLARQQCADLFLDTVPYNAHTTCSDALWMGLPVVTWRGDTFASRVAASLLHALGVPELIAESAEAYFDLALALAHDAVRRNALRGRIAAKRRESSLFDSERFTRDLEQAYLHMLARQEGKARHVQIVVAAFDHAQSARISALEEAARDICAGLHLLGVSAKAARNAFDRHGLNIVLGADRLTAESALLLPPRAILYRLPGDAQGAQWMTPVLRDLLGEYEAWDGDEHSTAAVSAALPGAKINYVPFDDVPGAILRLRESA